MQTIRSATWGTCWAVSLALVQACAWAAEPASAAGLPSVALAKEGASAQAAPVHEPRLRSAMAIVVDQDTDEVLYQKNADHVSSIASITKLMTAMVTLDSQLPLDEDLTVTREDRANGWANSRLRPGTHLSREQALHLALMSSENHAAYLLGRTYPGGIAAIVDAMNAKAQLIGMSDASFADPTGLSPDNRASAADLVRLVKAAYDYPEIRYDSVSTDLIVPVGHHAVRYQNTNHLTSRPDWQIGLQKTGYIAAAGRCLVMQAAIEGRRVVMVLLDSVGSASRFADAQRLRDWIKATKVRAETSADTTTRATF